jgi:hypothetical protein
VCVCVYACKPTVNSFTKILSSHACMRMYVRMYMHVVRQRMYMPFSTDTYLLCACFFLSPTKQPPTHIPITNSDGGLSICGHLVGNIRKSQAVDLPSSAREAARDTCAPRRRHGRGSCSVYFDQPPGYYQGMHICVCLYIDIDILHIWEAWWREL